MKGFLEGTDPLHAIILCTNSYVADAIRHGLRYAFSEILFGETPVETNFSNSLQIVGHDVAWKVSGFFVFDTLSSEISVIGMRFLTAISNYWELGAAVAC